MNNMEKFGRFKYAEEHAHRLDDDDRKWKMYRGEDEEYDEDGVKYTHPVYIVEWS